MCVLENQGAEIRINFSFLRQVTENLEKYKLSNFKVRL